MLGLRIPSRLAQCIYLSNWQTVIPLADTNVVPKEPPVSLSSLPATKELGTISDLAIEFVTGNSEKVAIFRKLAIKKETTGKLTEREINGQRCNQV